MEIPKALDRQVTLPQSKSIAARVLIINALAQKPHMPLKNETTGSDPFVSFCDDNAVLAAALRADFETTGSDPIVSFSGEGGFIDVGAAGTAMRFLTAYFACREGRTVTLDGSVRMRQRPVGPLVDALRQMGAVIEYLGNEGCPPLKIEGRTLHGGAVVMRGDVSSQFVSALLMIAPVAGGITLTLEGDIVSRPYIDMTLALMRHYGIESQWCGSQIVVPAAHYLPASNYIEGDWSAASYWFALKALLPESRIVLSPLRRDSLQGDRAIVEMMIPLGVKARFLEGDNVLLPPSRSFSVNGLHLTNVKTRASHSCCYERDMASTPDLVPTLAVTLCLLRVPFTLTGVATLRLKESDRLEALREELAKLGYVVEVGADSLSYDGNHAEIHGEVTLDPHGDHRMAMALSLTATRHKILIKNAEVVTKSYPRWWEQLFNA